MGAQASDWSHSNPNTGDVGLITKREGPHYVGVHLHKNMVGRKKYMNPTSKGVDC